MGTENLEHPITYQTADQRYPFMGLNNQICKNPVYWCRLHRIWLSEEDVKRKACKCKMDFDLFGTHRCENLERKKNDVTNHM